MTNNDIKIVCEKIESLHEKILKSKFAETVTESEMLSLILAVRGLNDQKAEIERLEAMLDAAEEHFAPLPFKNKFDEYIEKSQVKAIREFADRLVAIYENDKTYDRPNAHTLVMTLFRNIDNLVKEMTEAEKVMATCKDCVHFIGAGDWNLCCTESHEGYPFGFLCYDDTPACEKFEEKRNC